MEKKSKTKEGIANFLVLLGLLFVIMGIYTAIDLGLDKGAGTAALLCFIGTVCSFTAGYIKNGYFKFFN